LLIAYADGELAGTLRLTFGTGPGAGRLVAKDQQP